MNVLKKGVSLAAGAASFAAMRLPFRRAAVVAALAALAAPATAPAHDHRDRTLRVATFNASLNRAAEGRLIANLSTPADTQAGAVAEVIQRVRPDVLLINEFDYDAQGTAARLFQDNYLSVGRNGAAPIHYPHRYSAPSNTGIPTGFDLNNNGVVGGGDDAFGFGFFPGQFGMQVYSRHPIAERFVRTFQNFCWTDMPGAKMPTPFYSPEEQAILRLSSKSHWDLPLVVDGKVVHLLASHPTPPVFDGPEDRNGTRNHDEIRFWADYVGHRRGSAYIYDDEGRYGGLHRGARFVIAGDQNSDPLDGDSIPGAAQQLLDHPRIDANLAPRSDGAVEATALQGGANLTHRSDPQFDTADFADTAPGNLRADYVLPSRRGFKVRGGFVFWPPSSDPLSRLTGMFPFPTSDHRLVALDLEVS